MQEDIKREGKEDDQGVEGVEGGVEISGGCVSGW